MIMINRLVEEGLNDLFQHARDEDENFHPFVRERLSTEHLRMIEDRIR